jgi:hypothetical protein
MRFTLPGSLALLLLCGAARADETKKDEPKPADLPIKAKLIAKKDTYSLDLGGKTAEEYRKALKEAEPTGKVPDAPAVELSLELTNTSDKEVQFWVSGDPVQVVLDLKGDGALTLTPRRAFTREFRVPKPMALAPGKSHTIPINALQFGTRGVAQQAYWTQPGEYTLGASFNTAISPAPKGSKEGENGFGRVVIAAEPIKIKVESK